MNRVICTLILILCTSLGCAGGDAENASPRLDEAQEVGSEVSDLLGEWYEHDDGTGTLTILSIDPVCTVRIDLADGTSVVFSEWDRGETSDSVADVYMLEGTHFDAYLRLGLVVHKEDHSSVLLNWYDDSGDEMGTSEFSR